MVLSTDGDNISFAAFVYKDPESISSFTGFHQSGFDAGDNVGSLNFVGSDPGTMYTGSLQGINAFRLDGMALLINHKL